MTKLMSIMGAENAYKSIGNQAAPTATGKGGFAQVLGGLLQETAAGIHTNEADMKKYALGMGGDMTQLTFNTAELANKVKMVSGVVQKVAGTWNDLTKMQI